MDATLLIDAIVRQTTVLIAQLATTSGARATLAGTANQVFFNLVQELKQQGLGNKVIAEMFGLALRTYHNRLRRLAESESFAGRSLWEAVLEYVRESGPVTRAQVLARFVRDEPLQVRAVLNDLVGSQLLGRTGRGGATSYRLATAEDRVAETEQQAVERLACLLWVVVHRFGPLSSEKLRELVPASADQLAQALLQLEADGRVYRTPGGAEWRAENYVIPVGAREGFEAAIFDHYQAMVTALCSKLREGQQQSLPDDLVGGSTYAFDVWENHPHYAEVSGFLASVRRQAVTLRQRVESYNDANPRPGSLTEQRFIAYVGQTLIADEPNDTAEGE